jgi:hypothetical protein
MELSIQEAAKRFKVGRSTIYKKFSTGELSRLPNGKIDLSEFLRVFGNSPQSVSKTVHKTSIDTSSRYIETPEKDPLYKAQEDKIRLLEESLRQAQERERTYLDREEWQRGQIEKLTDTIKLLESPKDINFSKKSEYSWLHHWLQWLKNKTF